MTKKRNAPSSVSEQTKSKAKSAKKQKPKMSYMERLRMFTAAPKIFLLPLYAFANNGIISGRQDNNVMMRNNRSRGMAMPSNPMTPAQTTQRGNFGFLSGNWSSLTEVQRDSWRALTVNTFDRLGHSVTLTGKELYVALNRNLFNSGNALLTTAPTPSSPIPPATLTLQSSLSGMHFRIAFTATPIPAGVTYLVFGTAPQSAGTARPGPSKYKLLTALPAATASPADVSAAYDAVFGTVIVGSRVFVRVIAIKNSTGFAAPWVIASVETAA